MQPEIDEAFEQWPARQRRVGVVLTCEHASERLPDAWSWPSADRRLLGTHWASDLGIADLTRELAEALGCAATLSRFTRLLIDPNRPLSSPTLFRSHCDGEPVQLNVGLTDADRHARIRGYYRPYHVACDAMVAAQAGALVLGMHSYTPSYEGNRREVELGVLWDADDDLGEHWTRRLAELSGWDVRGNAPWSGKDGLMFGPQHHATQHGRPAIELELRQDLAVDPVARAKVVGWLVELIRETHPPAPR